MKKILAGVSKALILQGNNLLAICNTLTDSTFEASITAEEIRGGAGNALWAKYFHDSVLNVTLTDIVFDLNRMAVSFGTNLRQGGTSIKEEESTVTTAKQIPLSTTPLAYEGVLVAWYSKPGIDDWKVGTVKFAANKYYIEVDSATVNEKYCVK